MFDIKNEELTFTVSPFERVIDNEIDPEHHRWDWIKSFIEFSVPGLTAQFQTEFTVGELQTLCKQFSAHYDSLITRREINPFEFRSERRQLNMIIRKMAGTDSVIIEYELRPEAHADSVQVKGDFSINESYFADILKRLDEMIAWVS